MSINPSKDLHRSSIPKFDGTGTWINYDAGVKQVLLLECVHAHDCLITGKEQTFIPPSLDLLVKVARRLNAPGLSALLSAARTPPNAGTPAPPAAAPAAEVQPPDLPPDLPPSKFAPIADPSVLPLWTSPPNPTAASYKDEKFYYLLRRASEYFGPEGEHIWRQRQSHIAKSEYNYNTYEKKTAWSLLYSSISGPFQDKININPDYAAKHATIDYIWLYSCIKFVITGEGPTSLSLSFIRIAGLKMKDNNFDTYAKDHMDIREDIASRKIPGDKVVDQLFDVLFHIGLRDASNNILKPQLDIIFGSATWPTAAQSISEFSKYLTTVQKLDTTYSGEGVIQANIAKTRKPTGAKTNTNICWNCGRPGHVCMNCKAPVATCATCQGNHHTSAHEKVKAAEERKAARSTSKPSFEESYKRVSANYAKESTETSYDDDDQYDAIETISAHQAAIEDKALEDAADAQEEYNDEDELKSIMAYSTKVTKFDKDDNDVPDLASSSDDETKYGRKLCTQKEQPIPRLIYDSQSSDSDDDNEKVPPLMMDSDSDDEIFTAHRKRVTTKKSTNSKVTFKEPNTDKVKAKGSTSPGDTIKLGKAAWNVATTIQAHSAIHMASEDIVAYLDTGAGAHIFLPEQSTALMFSHITASKGIVIEGVSEDAKPIPVSSTGKHWQIGHVHFAQIRNPLISIPRLLLKGWTMIGKKDSIIISDERNHEVFNAKPDDKGLYPVNLSAMHRLAHPTATIPALEGTLVHPPPKIDMPMTHLEIERAHQCRHLHESSGHPSDETMAEALNNGVWPLIDLTSRDLKNANQILGPCAACYEGKMTNPSEPANKEIRATMPGELLYCDLLKTYGKCISGFTQALVTRDAVTSYMTVTGMIDKTANSIQKSLESIISFYKSFGHTVRVLVMDHEATFIALENKIPGIRCQFTPATMHNKPIERAIRELKEKDRCVRAHLPYQLPYNVEIEVWIAVCESINSLPNSATGPNHTPFQLVTSMRPSVRPIATGKPVQVPARKASDPNQVAEWGIYMSQSFRGDHRVYLPQHSVIVSRRKVIEQESYPNDWHFVRRPRLVVPTVVPSIADAPEPIIPTPASANPLIIPSVFNMPPAQAPPPVVSQLPAQPDTTTPTLTTSMQSEFPSISRFIPGAIPPSPAAAVTPQREAAPASAPTVTAPPVRPTAASAQPAVQPKAAAAAPSDQPRYNLRTNRNKPDRYESGYMALPTSINAFHFNYGKGVRGVPVVNQRKIVDHDKVRARIIACRISMRQALKDPDPIRSQAAATALKEELMQLVESGTFDPKRFDQLTPEQRRRVIPSHMFFKDKFFADGRFQKLKARLVAGGNFVDTSLVGDISSWTVNPISVMMMLNVAALRKLSILTIDVKGAFLIPDLTDSPSDLTYVTIDKTLSDEILKLKPEWSNLRNTNYTFTMQLKKTLYGLGISSNRWMTHLNGTLLKLGFTVSPGDRCLFTRGADDRKIFICSHVDDILCIGKPPAINAFREAFAREYEINAQEGFKHSYIGLDIIQEESTHKVSIGQTGYRRDVLIRFRDLLDLDRAGPKIPCGADIVEAAPPTSGPVDRHLYMSIIMSVMFLSRFTRPDLAFAVSILSTHCTNPVKQHMRQAIKMLQYIANTADLAITFLPAMPNPTIYADASHTTHHDGYGHGCIIIKLGTGILYCRSYKLKIVTLSSTESEHVVLCDASTLAEWLTPQLQFMKVAVEKILVRQDNTSTIWLSENEGNFARNKHLLIRRNKAKEAVLNGTINIQYCPTETMLADLGTKPLSVRQLAIHMRNAGLMIVTRPNGVYTLGRIEVPAARVFNRREPVERPVPPPVTPQRSTAPPAVIRAKTWRVAGGNSTIR